MNTSEIRNLAKESIKGKYFKAAVIFLIYMVLSSVLVFIPFVGSIGVILLSIPLSYGIICSMIKLRRNEQVGYFDFISIAFSEFSNAWKVFFSMLGKIWPYLLGYFGSTFFIVMGSVIFFVLAFSGSLSSSSASSFVAAIPGLILFGIGIIAGIVFYILLLLKTLYYSLSYYVLYDDSTLKGKEVVEKSHELMKGHRWDIIKMQIPYYLILLGINIIIGILFSITNVVFETEAFYYIMNICIYIPMLFIIPLIQFATIHFYEKLTGKTYEADAIVVNNDNIIDTNTQPINQENVTSTDKKGFSIAALILGIISIVTICFFPLSMICGILAIVFGIIGLFKAEKGMGIAGIITGSLGIILAFITALILILSTSYAILSDTDSSTDSKYSSRNTTYYNRYYY